MHVLIGKFKRENKMFLDIVIPTLNRTRKLINCLESIERSKKNFDIHVFIYFSSHTDANEVEASFDRPWITRRFTLYNKCGVFWNAHLLIMKADIMAYMNDDVLFFDNTIEELVKTYQEHFPDFDGVMGINQSNLPEKEMLKSAFGVIGNKYAERFPDRQAWCPDFYRFGGDEELMRYAESINKFYYAENVKIKHLHPAHEKGCSTDSTHRAVRKFRSKDVEICHKRKVNKLMWGQSFELIGEL